MGAPRDGSDEVIPDGLYADELEELTVEIVTNDEPLSDQIPELLLNLFLEEIPLDERDAPVLNDREFLRLKAEYITQLVMNSQHFNGVGLYYRMKYVVFMAGQAPDGRFDGLRVLRNRLKLYFPDHIQAASASTPIEDALNFRVASDGQIFQLHV